MNDIEDTQLKTLAESEAATAIEAMDGPHYQNYVEAMNAQVGDNQQMNFPQVKHVTVLHQSGSGHFDLCEIQKFMASTMPRLDLLERRLNDVTEEKTELRDQLVIQKQQLAQQHEKIQRQERKMTRQDGLIKEQQEKIATQERQLLVDSRQHIELHQMINDLQNQKQVLEDNFKQQQRNLKKLHRKFKREQCCFSCLRGTVQASELCIKAGRAGCGRPLSGDYMRV